MGDDELSVCVRLGSLGEAHALTAILDEEQIPCRERPYQDTAFDGIGLAMNQQIGWGEVWVRAADEARVQEALEALRAAAGPEPAAAAAADAAAAPAAPPAPEAEAAETPRPNLRGLWLLIGVLILIIGGVLVSAMLGGDRCDRFSDPAKREQCEQQLERERAKVQQPRDWR
jgi:hypothetical protein